jgi:UPF0271 protein
VKWHNVIDINCDLGEGCRSEQWEQDEALMSWISSCNIACGGHAGNMESIRVSVANAMVHHLKIGAHPGYPDPDHFGRVSLSLSEKALRNTLRQQVELLAEACAQQGEVLHHVKPHGALYNDAAVALDLAGLIAEEIRAVRQDLILVGLAQSQMYHAALSVGLPFWQEGFIDRAYLPDGQLVPRSHPLALHSSLDSCLDQAEALVRGMPVRAVDGTPVMLKVDTLCVHGDTPGALTMLQALNQRLCEIFKS